LAQFDVYVNESNIQRDAIPYLLNIQSDSLADLRTRIVAPLRLRMETKAVSNRLNPAFVIEDREVILMIQELLYLPAGVLGRRVRSLAEEREQIIRALDLLVVGF
jgi:toxin CcdB